MITDNKVMGSVGVGMAIGAAIGLATGNMALWLSLGLVFGAGYAKTKKAKEDKDNIDKSH